jgi:uncharacterized membrane protein
MTKRKWITYIVFVLCLLGLGVSAYLAYEYAQPFKIGCPVSGTGCEDVRNSSYSRLFGISVPYYGLLYYGVMTFLTILSTQFDTKRLSMILFLGSLSGFLASAYFTYLEAYVIHAYCFWCITSAIISTCIFIVCTMKILNSKKQETNK